MFKGSNVALITPFKNDKFDEDAYIKLIHFHIKNGTNGANFSKKGSYYIHSYSDEKTPPKYSLYQTRKNKFIRELLNNQKLSKTLALYNLPNKEFSTLNVNGFNLNMWMIKPTNFNPEKKISIVNLSVFRTWISRS